MPDRILKDNLRLARFRWKGNLSPSSTQLLKRLTNHFQFSIAEGDIIWLEHGWYVTHTGLIRLARRNRCAGIHTKPVADFCSAQTQRWAFEAIVYTTKACRGFVGHGDADPSNVSALVRGAEMRLAETRAVCRALRRAYGIGICSVEELGSLPQPAGAARESKKLPSQPANGNCGGRTVRDRLCQIIRQHKLDAGLVKAYAIDYSGAKTLREATREQVENFVQHLADWAEKDRDALLCQLNSYLGTKDGAA